MIRGRTYRYEYVDRKRAPTRFVVKRRDRTVCEIDGEGNAQTVCEILNARRVLTVKERREMGAQPQ